MTPPEFHRPERVDTIGGTPRDVAIAADGAECAGLAARFGLVEVSALSARLSVRRDAGGIRASGHVRGAVVQQCTVTGDAVPAVIDEAVDLRFVDGDAVVATSEVELSADDLDQIEYRGGTIDLGEAAAETLALALDPFPRGPRAEAVLREAGVLREGEAGPFGALAGLKEQLAGRS